MVFILCFVFIFLFDLQLYLRERYGVERRDLMHLLLEVNPIKVYRCWELFSFLFPAMRSNKQVMFKLNLISSFFYGR